MLRGLAQQTREATALTPAESGERQRARDPGTRLGNCDQRKLDVVWNSSTIAIKSVVDRKYVAVARGHRKSIAELTHCQRSFRRVAV